MRVGPATEHSDVCSMLHRLHHLESGIADEDLISRVNSALTKLAPNSLLNAKWHETQSQYQETTALINRCRSELVETRSRLAPDDKDSSQKIETPSCQGSEYVYKRSSPQQRSRAEKHCPPVCHVKPTKVLNESDSSSSSAPFDVRNYVIDKNVPIAEPVLKPQLISLVQDCRRRSLDAAHRQSSDAAVPVDLRCIQSARAPFVPAVKSTASALPPVRSRWKELKKKAVGLLTDGLAGSRSGPQSEHSSPHRLTASSLSTASLHRLTAAITRTILIYWCQRADIPSLGS